MAVEIERKFLVRNDSYKLLTTPVFCRQGYISTNMNSVVRVRIAGDRACMTLKSLVSRKSRLEYEYKIPVADAREILDKICRKPIIEKDRYELKVGANVWVVDEFYGKNEGLVIAEIELESEDQEIRIPEWVGDEVTDDPRYLNANLLTHPFVNWKKNKQ